MASCAAFRRLALVACLAAFAACGGVEVSDIVTPVPVVDVTGTALEPLPADPVFEGAARHVCLSQYPLGDDVALVLQDQRRADMAYLLFEGSNDIAECLLRREPGGDFTTLSSDAMSALGGAPDALMVTGVTSFDDSGMARLVTGTAPVSVTTVILVRSDGVQVRASVGNGSFAAWWLVGGDVTVAIGYGADGNEWQRDPAPPRLDGP